MNPVRTPRLVVLLILWSNLGWALGLPWRLTNPPTTPGDVLLAVVLVLGGALLAAVAWAAVTPTVRYRTRANLLLGAIAVAAAAWLPCYAWASAGQEPWAWFAAAVLGGAPLVVSWRASVAAGVGLCAAAIGGALWSGQSVGQNLMFLLGSGAVFMLIGQTSVWLLRLLVAAEVARASEAEVAMTQERLRVARDLHDVLGHRLGVIALKAELAAELAGSDSVKAREENVAIQSLARETVREARAALRGDTADDLREQLRSASLVLSSAGVDIEVTGAVDPEAPAVSSVFAAVVREAVTNILRHADADTVKIALSGEPEHPILVIVNDGATGQEPESTPGRGLPGLAERCAAAGVRLRWGHLAGNLFELRAERPSA
ncbi:two-component system sensor histidine kinase DesK [Herbihabitans rhizosphaerae]|uniref:Two-component system sensor histidine kinase DesK n=1 Tax=Herbihabitans rhizosphaerae TaxID=1872711 RepID=A0A4Q7L803_9PSEU|nr:histidine kinase [Herbihabitans rhizosphaerae]RZS45040.1 two-component system sensor histidine kinase DesK [Herbihabitans rhizosphaerae]